MRLADPFNGGLAPGVVVNQIRQLTLNEVQGPDGPLEVLVNNTRMDGTARPDFAPVSVGGQVTYVSELPYEGSTELWEIVNLTADAHPIHTHLTQFQLMNRQKFHARRYASVYDRSFPGGAFIPGFGPPLNYVSGNTRALGGNPDVSPYAQGPVMLPAANEAGWKDTVMVLPGQVTRLIVRYAPQDKPVGAMDLSYPFDPSAGGGGYVVHCHIIDHEDNEMMRPVYVLPIPGALRSFAQGLDY